MFPPANAALPQPPGALFTPPNESEKRAIRRRQQQLLQERLQRELMRQRTLEREKRQSK